jgi:serine phosphatase RsbU (regulator of sigma subunit)
MARTRTSLRRRQRSVRVTVAVALLCVATLAVLAALPTQSPALLSTAAVAALALGWAAMRITWTEVLQSRRENAADRAATASAYRTLFSERAAEHAEFTTAMTERLAESNSSMHELEGELEQAQRQAATLTARAETAESAHATALVRVAELVRSIEVLRSGQAAALDALDDAEAGSVEDLVAFDEKIAQASGKHSAEAAQAARLA